MQLIENALRENKTNFILIGEAGCGKSEIALNLAKLLASRYSETGKKVHLFDMDMTKPLFRSRDFKDEEEFGDVEIHYEEQFYDAPTVVGGVREYLKDENSIVVMDVGGDDIGARLIGGFMLGVDKDSLCVMYVLNYFRPFCQDIDHIDTFLGEILAVSHLSVDDIHMVHNPNAGITTSLDEIIDGEKRIQDIISAYKDVEMICVRERFVESLSDKISKDLILPLKLYLTYEWLESDAS